MVTRAIVFDLDETLIVEDASVDASFLAACRLASERYGVDAEALHRAVRAKAHALWHASPVRRYCVDIGISSWEGLSGRFTGDDDNLKILRDWVPTYRRASWLEALNEFGKDDASFAEQLALAFQNERRKRHVVYPDTEPVLKRLREAFRLGLLTNGAPDIQREKIDKSGLEPYFETIIVSGELGIGKPDKRIFGMVLDRLGVTAGETVIVGDSLRSDIAGAKGAGLTAIWMNRLKKVNEGPAQPDAEVHDMEELCEFLNVMK